MIIYQWVLIEGYLCHSPLLDGCRLSVQACSHTHSLVRFIQSRLDYNQHGKVWEWFDWLFICMSLHTDNRTTIQCSHEPIAMIDMTATTAKDARKIIKYCPPFFFQRISAAEIKGRYFLVLLWLLCWLSTDFWWVRRFQWIRSFITLFVEHVLKVYHGKKWSQHIGQMM